MAALLKEYGTKTRTYGDESVVRKEALTLGYASSALESVWPKSSCPPNLKQYYGVLLISHGGSGSSSGFKYFTNVLGVNSTHMNYVDDRDSLKHRDFFSLSRMLVQCNVTARIIVYQLGDPTDAVFSLYRRGFAEFHFRKLRPAFHDLTCTRGIQRNVSLYAHAKQDLIGLNDHLDSYLMGSNSRPVVFMNAVGRNMPGFASEIRKILMTFGVVFNGAGGNNTIDSIDTKQPNEEERIDETSSLESKYRDMNGYAEMRTTYQRMTNTVGILSPLSVCVQGRIYRWTKQ